MGVWKTHLVTMTLKTQEANRRQLPRGVTIPQGRGKTPIAYLHFTSYELLASHCWIAPSRSHNNTFLRK